MVVEGVIYLMLYSVEQSSNLYIIDNPKNLGLALEWLKNLALVQPKN